MRDSCAGARYFGATSRAKVSWLPVNICDGVKF